MTQIKFEFSNAPARHVPSQAKLHLYASDRINGIRCGRRLNLAKRGYRLNTATERAIDCDIEEKLCYVILGIEQKMIANATSTNCYSCIEARNHK